MKSGKTRWLSRASVVKTLLPMLPALVQVFAQAGASDTSSEDIGAAALHTAITSYMFVGVLAGMNDLLGLLTLLSQSFQSDVMDYSKFQKRLFEVRTSIINI